MNRIAKAFGGKVDQNNQIKLPTESITYDKMEETMKRVGFTEFTNENFRYHTPTYAFGYGAYHWEGNVGGNWYHLNFPRTGFLSDTVRLAPDAHYEVDRSDSITHRNATGERTKCQK